MNGKLSHRPERSSSKVWQTWKSRDITIKCGITSLQLQLPKMPQEKVVVKNEKLAKLQKNPHLKQLLQIRDKSQIKRRKSQQLPNLPPENQWPELPQLLQ
jgi:hypothetical protein